MKQIQGIISLFLIVFYTTSVIVDFAPRCNSEKDHQKTMASIHQFFHHQNDSEACYDYIGEEDLVRDSFIYRLLHDLYDSDHSENENCETSIVADVHHIQNSNFKIVSDLTGLLPQQKTLISLFEKRIKSFVFNETNYSTYFHTTQPLRGPPHLLV